MEPNDDDDRTIEHFVLSSTGRYVATCQENGVCQVSRTQGGDMNVNFLTAAF